MDSPADLRAAYISGIDEKLARRQLRREPQWTESLAVGDRLFVEKAARSFSGRYKFEYSTIIAASDAWSVREEESPYNPVSVLKSARKDR